MYRSCPEDLGEPQIVHPLNPKHVLKRNSSARIVSGRPSSEHSLPLLPDGPLSSKFIRNVRGASHWIPSLYIGRRYASRRERQSNPPKGILQQNAGLATRVHFA